MTIKFKYEPQQLRYQYPIDNVKLARIALKQQHPNIEQEDWEQVANNDPKEADKEYIVLPHVIPSIESRDTTEYIKYPGVMYTES